MPRYRRLAGSITSHSSDSTSRGGDRSSVVDDFTLESFTNESSDEDSPHNVNTYKTPKQNRKLRSLPQKTEETSSLCLVKWLSSEVLRFASSILECGKKCIRYISYGDYNKYDDAQRSSYRKKRRFKKNRDRSFASEDTKGRKRRIDKREKHRTKKLSYKGHLTDSVAKKGLSTLGFEEECIEDILKIIKTAYGEPKKVNRCKGGFKEPESDSSKLSSDYDGVAEELDSSTDERREKDDIIQLYSSAYQSVESRQITTSSTEHFIAKSDISNYSGHYCQRVGTKCKSNNKNTYLDDQNRTNSREKSKHGPSNTVTTDIGNSSVNCRSSVSNQIEDKRAKSVELEGGRSGFSKEGVGIVHIKMHPETAESTKVRSPPHRSSTGPDDLDEKNQADINELLREESSVRIDLNDLNDKQHISATEPTSPKGTEPSSNISLTHSSHDTADYSNCQQNTTIKEENTRESKKLISADNHAKERSNTPEESQDIPSQRSHTKSVFISNHRFFQNMSVDQISDDVSPETETVVERLPNTNQEDERDNLVGEKPLKDKLNTVNSAKPEHDMKFDSEQSPASRTSWNQDMMEKNGRRSSLSASEKSPSTQHNNSRIPETKMELDTIIKSEITTLRSEDEVKAMINESIERSMMKADDAHVSLDQHIHGANGSSPTTINQSVLSDKQFKKHSVSAIPNSLNQEGKRSSIKSDDGFRSDFSNEESMKAGDSNAIITIVGSKKSYLDGSQISDQITSEIRDESGAKPLDFDDQLIQPNFMANDNGLVDKKSPSEKQNSPAGRNSIGRNDQVLGNSSNTPPMTNDYRENSHEGTSNRGSPGAAVDETKTSANEGSEILQKGLANGKVSPATIEKGNLASNESPNGKEEINNTIQSSPVDDESIKVSPEMNDTSKEVSTTLLSASSLSINLDVRRTASNISARAAAAREKFSSSRGHSGSPHVKAMKSADSPITTKNVETNSDEDTIALKFSNTNIAHSNMKGKNSGSEVNGLQRNSIIRDQSKATPSNELPQVGSRRERGLSINVLPPVKEEDEDGLMYVRQRESPAAFRKSVSRKSILFKGLEESCQPLNLPSIIAASDVKTGKNEECNCRSMCNCCKCGNKEEQLPIPPVASSSKKIKKEGPFDFSTPPFPKDSLKVLTSPFFAHWSYYDVDQDHPLSKYLKRSEHTALDTECIILKNYRLGDICMPYINISSRKKITTKLVCNYYKKRSLISKKRHPDSCHKRKDDNVSSGNADCGKSKMKYCYCKKKENRQSSENDDIWEGYVDTEEEFVLPVELKEREVDAQQTNAEGKLSCDSGTDCGCVQVAELTRHTSPLLLPTTPCESCDCFIDEVASDSSSTNVLHSSVASGVTFEGSDSSKNMVVGDYFNNLQDLVVQLFGTINKMKSIIEDPNSLPHYDVAHSVSPKSKKEKTPS